MSNKALGNIVYVVGIETFVVDRHLLEQKEPRKGMLAFRYSALGPISLKFSDFEYQNTIHMKTAKLCTFPIPRPLFVLICLAALFSGCCEEDLEEPIEEVEADSVYINEATLKDVYYHQVTYDRPTILIFPNLKTAFNSVYFHLCVNIIEVHFPNLVSIGDMNAGNPYFYFHKNEGLKKVSAPKLTTVYGYIYLYGNSSLDLSTGTCGIIDVYPRSGPNQIDCYDPAVDIVGNANNDKCFTAVLHLCN